MIESDTPACSSLDGATSLRDALSDKVRAAVADLHRGSLRLRQVAVPAPSDVSPLAWLRAQRSDEAAYWSGRDDNRTVAAVGAADIVEGARAPIDYDVLQARLDDRLASAGDSVRYYGGLRFDAPQPRATNRPNAGWEAFGTYRFVLPRFEWVEAGGESWLACNLLLPRDTRKIDALLSSIRMLKFPTASSSPDLPRPYERADTPGCEDWTQLVRWALDAIGDGSLDKVVLARRVAMTFGAAVDPFQVLRRLRDDTPNCFHFAVRPAGGPAFIGAPPERLLRREGRTVQSEAVAGTRPRGDTTAADDALRSELQKSPKERREHAFVQNAIQADLDALCTSVETPDAPADLALSRRRHLHAPVTGTLREGISTIDLIEALHPTPAVGGVPRDAALTAIRTQEPFDRGWYAGPVGWIGPDAADLAVAIRSGLVQGPRLALFSGAGIVDGSEPNREWDEIEQKIGDFAAILGLKPQTPDANFH